MIQKLRNNHIGKSIAIVGSGPTAFKFKNKEDIAIAVNGAIQLDGAVFDYFQAFDLTLVKKKWFQPYPLNRKETRIIGIGLSKHDRYLYPNLMHDKRVSVRGNSVVDNTGHPEPTPPHIYFRYVHRKYPDDCRSIEEIKSGDILTTGNISICAIETAIIMGASRINIYGIDMSNRRYFYDGGGNKPKGQYSKNHAEFVNDIFSKCISSGIIVGRCCSDSSAITVGERID